MGQKEYFIDLLFYHRFLKALVAFELKVGPFAPEHAGKMDFYLNLLNDKERGDGDHLRQRHDDTEGLFRLIQSIPSPKAEPFKRWMARVGKEWIDTLFATDYFLYGN